MLACLLIAGLVLAKMLHIRDKIENMYGQYLRKAEFETILIDPRRAVYAYGLWYCQTSGVDREVQRQSLLASDDMKIRIECKTVSR